MKFGQTLYQRSIPQWSNYNVDYNDLKQLIKERTSGHGATNPVTIPGQGTADVAWAQLDDELFLILCQQHERVNLFTRSKYGEFERRMDYVDRQARSLTRLHNPSPSRPLQYTRTYGKLAREVESVSEDIQSLSRYVTMQRQAFRKILKKYQKWTGSSSLEHRMNNKVFNQPTSLLRSDFSRLLDRLEEAKANLTGFMRLGGPDGENRTGTEGGDSPISLQAPRSSAAQLHHVCLHSSELEFDAAFSALPLGQAGGRASYWIHEDNLEEATVLMRRYMRNRGGLTPSLPTRSDSHTSMSSVHAKESQCARPKERTHIAMFDNLQRFVQAYGAVTVGQAEALAGSTSSMLAMTILWADRPRAVVMTSELSPLVAPIHRRVEIMPISSKSLAQLFAAEVCPTSKTSKESGKMSTASEPNLQICRDWLAQNRDVKPLTQVQCTRSRFAGLNNTSEVGTWALMDQDITMSRMDTSVAGHSCLADTDHVQAFPYTVVEVRWEFSRSPEIVRALNSTHLVERVRGFSLDAQAIKAVCNPPDMPTPMWQPLLDRDIRKVPPMQSRANPRRRRSLMASSAQSSTDNDPSASTLSTAATLTSATSPSASGRSSPRPTSPSLKPPIPEKRVGGKVTSSRHLARHPRPAVQRYWNEFDDGDDSGEEERYAIYVHPDEETSIPGAETVTKVFSSMYQSLGRTKRRLASWLPLRSRQDGSEAGLEQGVRRPLLGHSGIDQDEYESSDSEPWTPKPKPSKKMCSAQGYGTTRYRTSSLSQPRRSHGHGSVTASRERALCWTYLGCYAMSLVLLIMSSIMRTTGRHHARVQVEAGVMVGVIAAFASAIIALGLMMGRKEKLSWVHWSLGGCGFLLVFAWGGWLIALTSRSL